MFNFMHPVSVFRRKPVAELTVRQAVRTQAAAPIEGSQWVLNQAQSGAWQAAPQAAVCAPSGALPSSKTGV